MSGETINLEEALSTERMLGYNEAISRIKKISTVMHDYDQKEILVMNLCAFKNIADRYKK